MEDHERARAVRELLRARGVQTSETAAPIPRRAGGEAAPASSAQARIWFHTQLAPASIYYNVASRVALRGALDLEVLERAVSALADRQAVLRTTFEERDGRLIEVVRPSWGGTVTFEDVSAIAPDLRAAAVEQRTSLRAALPFDLVNGPIMRVHVIRRGSDDHVVLLSFHHIAVDGWAEPVVLAGRAELYRACVERRPSALPPLAAEYADFAIWHHRWLASDAARRQLAYWRAKLAGAPEALRLPFDQPHTGSAGRAREHAWVFAPATVRALERLAAAGAVSTFTVMFTAWAVLLSQYTGQRDLVIATLIANRTRPETEALVGFFVNTLPVRVGVAAGVTFRALLAQVKQVVLEAFANQDAPFDAIVKELKVERSASDTPLSNVLFADQRVARRELAFGEVAGRVERFQSAQADAHFPITFNLEEFAGDPGEGPGASVVFRSDLFEVATIAQLCRQFDRLLGWLLADPDRKLDEFAILEPEAARALLDAGRGAPADRSDPVLLHEMFDRQVARAPDAIAVAFHGHAWTYRELDRRAGQLAERLARCGGGQESAFGIYLPRGLDVPVAVLGILKAGGAYVALDPSYPAERLRQMISASGVRYLITRRGFGDPSIAATAELVELDPGSDA
jgi:hypothetical protein